jgi:hypothetical protein
MTCQGLSSETSIPWKRGSVAPRGGPAGDRWIPSQKHSVHVPILRVANYPIGPEIADLRLYHVCDMRLQKRSPPGLSSSTVVRNSSIAWPRTEIIDSVASSLPSETKFYMARSDSIVNRTPARCHADLQRLKPYTQRMAAIAGRR